MTERLLDAAEVADEKPGRRACLSASMIDCREIDREALLERVRARAVQSRVQTSAAENPSFAGVS